MPDLVADRIDNYNGNPHQPRQAEPGRSVVESMAGSDWNSNREEEHAENNSSSRHGSDHEEANNDSSDPPTGELKLRNYQLELAQPALPGRDGVGKNTITVAPTGSGKTIVALKVAMDFLAYTRNMGASSVTLPSKVVFLVNQVSQYIIHR